MQTSIPIIEQAHAVFPNLAVDLADERPRTIVARRLGRYGVTLLRAPAATVELSGRRAAHVGLGHHLKLIWLLAGRMHYDGPSRSFDVVPGDLIVTAMGEDYRLDMFDGHEALIMNFDPADDPGWSDLAGDALARPIRETAGIMVASAGARALLRAPEDYTAELAARCTIDVTLKSTQRRDGCVVSRSPVAARAVLHVLRNLAKPAYGPTHLARDMGVSLRTLYTRLTRVGTTPAQLIARTRLGRAREDVQNCRRPLLDIALANGFRDGASLSRAFRAAYGHPPSRLRRKD